MLKELKCSLIIRNVDLERQMYGARPKHSLSTLNSTQLTHYRKTLDHKFIFGANCMTRIWCVFIFMQIVVIKKLNDSDRNKWSS